MATEKEQLDEMLRTDEGTFQNLSKVYLYLQSWLAALNNYKLHGIRTVYKDEATYNADLALWNAQFNRYIGFKMAYEDRQAEYKKQGDAKESTNGVTRYLATAINDVQAYFDSLLGVKRGVGAIPIVIAVVAIIGIALTGITYLITNYYAKVKTDFSATANLAAEVGKTNPALAAAILKGSEEVQKNKDNEGFWNNLGKGAGTALTVAAVGAGVVTIAVIGEKQGWWKKIFGAKKGKRK